MPQPQRTCGRPRAHGNVRVGTRGVRLRPVPGGGKLGPLQERQFRLLWLGRVSSSFGDSLIGVALAFGVLSVSGSPFDLGLVLAAFTISRVALTLVGGVYADRLPRREVMLVCDGVRAIVEAFTAGKVPPRPQAPAPLFVAAA